MTGRRWPTALFASAYLALLVVTFQRISQLPIVLEYILALLAIAAIVTFFSHFGGSSTFLDRQLLLIGGSTLDIYVYHYFFIRFINLEFLKGYGILAEIFFTTILAILIVYASMAVGKGVRMVLKSA